MKRKLLSITLAACLIISTIMQSMMTVSAAAQTRMEALVTIIQIIGRENEALAETAANPFIDVNGNMEKYAAYAYKNGITAGIGNNKFAPDREITAEEYGIMLERAKKLTPIISDNNTLKIAEQGMFSAGGIVITSEGTFNPENQWEETGAGQTTHADHANVLYQIPENETGLPMVFLHGYGQSRMGWMTTPDGREGWSDIFLKYGHSVFLIDEPRRGEAGQTSVAGIISEKTLDQRWYTQFRIGKWINGKSLPNEGSQFPNDDYSVDQFFRQMTPDTGMKSNMGGDFDSEMVAKAVAATLDKVYEMTGKKSILLVHSQGGIAGWSVPQYTDKISAIVAIEPGGAPSADSEQYKKIAEQKLPVIFYFGDYIDNGDEKIMATGMWKMMRQTCYDFTKSYTNEGNNAIVIDLPKIGITGNSHFMFQEMNNDVIAEHLENWITENVK